MRLVAYIRVSSETQVEQGLGLDVQRETIRAWAKNHGHRIVGWAVDEGESGKNGLDTRVGLRDALEALKSRQADGLVVYRLDRLARSLTLQEGTLAMAWEYGATVFSVDLGEVPQDDPEDPMRTALRQIIGVFAQLERGLIVARLRSGRRLKAERGGYAYGAPPYGWEARDRELVRIPEEQAVIAKVVELRRAGASLREIGAALERDGHQPRRGYRWHPRVIAAILDRAGATPA